MSGRSPLPGGGAVFGLFRGGCQGIFGAIPGRIFGRIIERIVDSRRGAVWRLVVVVDLREFLPRLLGFTLPVPHTGIKSAGSQKPGVRAALGDASLIQHDNFIGADDGREPMRNHQRGAATRDALQRFLDFMLGVAVERGRRLVKHQDRRAFSTVRAIATRCFSPPESLSPRSPTSVSYPSGAMRMKPSIRARLAASSTSASVASQRP